MNAMIFAAGLGTRLAPLTNHIPKALVRVHDQPLIWYALNNVIAAGAVNIVVNVHHHADNVVAYLKSFSELRQDVQIHISNEQEELLETGGGLLKAKPFFIPDQPILIHNSDVLTNVNLKELIAYHNQRKSLATLMVEERNTNRYFLFDSNDILCGWENTKSGEKLLLDDNKNLKRFAFDGIHVVDYIILNLMGEVRKFSITKSYLEMAANQQIIGWHQWKAQWFDIGTPEKLQDASNKFKYFAVK